MTMRYTESGHVTHIRRANTHCKDCVDGKRRTDTDTFYPLYYCEAIERNISHGSASDPCSLFRRKQ